MTLSPPPPRAEALQQRRRMQLQLDVDSGNWCYQFGRFLRRLKTCFTLSQCFLLEIASKILQTTNVQHVLLRNISSFSLYLRLYRRTPSVPAFLRFACGIDTKLTYYSFCIKGTRNRTKIQDLLQQLLLVCVLHCFSAKIYLPWGNSKLYTMDGNSVSTVLTQTANYPALCWQFNKQRKQQYQETNDVVFPIQFLSALFDDLFN